MADVQHILEQIPIRHDLASHTMFLGIAQGFFLSLFIFLRAKKNSAILFLGWTFLFQSTVFLDTYLCYTGMMKHSIFLNDSTEPFVLMIGPMFYFFIYRLLIRRPVTFGKLWFHLVLPIGYALTQIPYYVSPPEVKLNAYLGAYHSNLEMASVPDSFRFSYHWIKDWFHQLVLLSFLVYVVLSASLVWNERERIRALPDGKKPGKYLFSRNSIFVLFLLFIILFFIFYSFEDDGGDHFIGIFITFITFITSALILMESRFFEKSWVADKYETLTSNSVSFEEVENTMEKEHLYLSEKVTLRSLADTMGTTPNLVSKVINSRTGSHFNDYINEKRVRIAKQRLNDSEYSNLTVEAIGLSVGFKSKSAFYSAFKKHTGLSPSVFMKRNQG